jgi:hypothetical protein
MNMEGGIEMNLNEHLWTKINKSRIFFPIHHGNSNHYSLLIMDNKSRKFIHMNPLRPKKKCQEPSVPPECQKNRKSSRYMFFFSVPIIVINSAYHFNSKTSNLLCIENVFLSKTICLLYAGASSNY